MRARLPLWRLTRTPTARGLYNALQAAGLDVALLDEFICEIDDGCQNTWTAPDAVSIEVTMAADRPERWAVSNAGLEDDHLVVAAVRRDEIVGQALVSPGGPVYVPELDRTIGFDGAYLWGVTVDPAWRRKGIASALLAAGLQEIRTADVPTAHALVAPDNHPSRALFREAGFTAHGRYGYVNAFGIEWRSRGNGEGEGPPEE